LVSIEAEDKYSGELWHSDFTNSVIEDLTSKAKNPKKYPVFVRMLMTALSRSNDSLNAEILTYR
jgi:coiled-coil domain-containing protein 61